MAQHDFVISNQGFPATRADINNFLQAVATTHSGTSTPSGAVAGTIWLDTTSATAPILKYYDGVDNITLATIDHVANTVNFTDSALDLITDTTPQLGGNLDVNGNSIVSTSNANITLAPNGTGDVVLSADTVKIGDLNANATITTDGTGDLILNTNSGSSSGSITIADGSNGNITIAPNGTGQVAVNGELVLSEDYKEGVVTIGTVGASHTISLANGTVQTATLTSATACTFTMPTATAGKSFIFLLKQPASGLNTPTTATFTGVKYPASLGAPIITAILGRMDILTFVADGTNWYGSYSQNYTP